MKLKVKTAAVMATMVACLSCGQHEQCADLDVTELIPQERLDFMKAVDANIDWAQDARACKIGEYLVFGPRDGASPELWVTQGEKAIAMIDANSSIVVFDGKMPVVTVENLDDDAGFDALRYDVRKDGTWLTVSDRDLDGQADLKYTSGPNRQHWMWFDGAWREIELGALRMLVDAEWKDYEVVDGVVGLVDEDRDE